MKMAKNFDLVPSLLRPEQAKAVFNSAVGAAAAGAGGDEDIGEELGRVDEGVFEVTGFGSDTVRLSRE